MLPNLSTLTLSTEAKRKERDDAEENALRILNEKNDGDLISKEGNANVLYSDDLDDLSALAVVLYTRHWDGVMNGFLGEKASLPDGKRPTSNNMYKGFGIVRHGFLMFMDPNVFYAEYMRGLADEPNEKLMYFARVESNCNLETMAIPESMVSEVRDVDGRLDRLNEDQLKRLEEVNTSVDDALEEFQNAFASDDETALDLYANAVWKMMDMLDDLWRPWLAFYEAEAKLKEKLKFRRRLRNKQAVTGAAPAQPAPRPPRAPRRRIINAAGVKGCALTDKILWVGLKVTEAQINFSQLSTAMRSATLNWAVAIMFAGQQGTVLGLLLDADVPVISVLDILGNHGPDFYCFASECEILIRDGCTYEKLPGASYEEQVETMKNDHPSYHDALIGSADQITTMRTTMNQFRRGWVPVFLSVRSSLVLPVAPMLRVVGLP